MVEALDANLEAAERIEFLRAPLDAVSGISD
jgi:hypothetical protein